MSDVCGICRRDDCDAFLHPEDCEWRAFVSCRDDAIDRLESELREARARLEECANGHRTIAEVHAKLAAERLARVEEERERDETNDALSETLDMLADAHAKMLIPICVHCGEKPGEDAKGTHWRECQKHPAHLEVARLMDINRNLRACGVRSELEVSRLADELERLRRTVAFMEEQYLKTHGGSWGVCRFQARVAEAEAARQRMREALERAPHGFLCLAVTIIEVASASNGPTAQAFKVRDPPEESLCNCWKRAALGAEPGDAAATPEGGK